MGTIRISLPEFRFSRSTQSPWREPRIHSGIWIWVLLLAFGSGSALAQNVLTTFAGTDWVFPANGKPAVNSPFSNIENVTLDSSGRVVFADPGNAVVVRIETSGTVTVLAGNGLQRYSGDGGPAVNAALNMPTDAVYDTKGNLYIADYGNNRIRMVTPDGNIKTIAGTGAFAFSGDGGPAVNATLNQPIRVLVDPAGNIYISDAANLRIRKITTDGNISTIAGTGKAGYTGDNGPATQAQVNDVESLAFDSAGNLYLADFGNNVVRMIDTKGNITTVAGNGTSGPPSTGVANKVPLHSPGGVFVDSSNNIYISDTNNYVIRKVDPQKNITTFAGTGRQGFGGDGGPASGANFNATFGLTGDSKGNLFIADRDNHRVRQINAAGTISSFAGNSNFQVVPNLTPAVNAYLNQPFGVSVDVNKIVYIADTFNNRIRTISPSGLIFTFAGNGSSAFSGDGGPAIEASLSGPSSITPDNAGNFYIADTDNNRVRKVSSSGIITTVAGNGTAGYSGDGGLAVNAALHSPQQVAVDSSGNLYISDLGNLRIRKVTSDGRISTIAGSGLVGFGGDGGPAQLASFNGVYGIAVASGKLYVADGHVRAINLVDGTISTVAGGGTLPESINPQPATQTALAFPLGITADGMGNVYFSDAFFSRILKLTSDGMLSVIAGTGTAGFNGDGGPATQGALDEPYGLALDASGNLLFADVVNDRIRIILTAPPSLTVSPSSLNISAASGGVISDAQTISIGSSPPGLIYLLGPSTTTGGSWLKTDVTSGNLPASVQVTADPTNLQPGTYQGLIRIIAGGGATSLAVNLTVAKAADPQLGTSSSRVNFSLTTGASAATQNLTLKNTGGGSLNFAASVVPVSGGNWLSVSGAPGQATPTAPATLTLQANPGTLATGTYISTLNITSDSGPVSIPVAMTISSAAQTIVLSQTAMKFTTVAGGGGSPFPQSFGIVNGGQGMLNWTVQPSVLSGASDGTVWITADTMSGTSTGGSTTVPAVNVGVNTAGLTPGEYYGRILVNAPGAANNPQSLTVVLDVLSTGSDPGPDVEPSGLILTGVAGTSPSSQLVSIANLSAQSTNFAIGKVTVDGQNWLLNAPTSGSVAPGQPVQVVVQPDFSNLQAGTYRGVLTFAFGQGTVRTVNLLAVVAPSGGAVSSDRTFGNAAGLGLQAGTCTPNAVNIVFQHPSTGFVAGVGQPTPIAVVITDNCTNPMTAQSNGTVNATFPNKQSTVLKYSNGAWTGTWTPAAAASNASVDVTAFWTEGNSLLSHTSSSVGSVVSGATNPLVTAGGIVHAASYAAGAPLAPCGLISIYGSNLADATGLAPGTPLPVTLNGSEANMGASNLPMLYASDGQVNAQVPCDVPINTQYQITVQRDNTLSMPESILIAEANPGVFTVNQQGSGQGVIFKSDQITLATPDNPAAPGEIIVIYCTGLGAVTPVIPPGFPAPADPLSTTTHPVIVSIGGSTASVDFAGLSPGFVGLYQVNARVPLGVSGDAVPVTLTVSGQVSPVVTMAVH
jgi:uncharacterized protein (TIGR03437 family)